MTYGTAQATLEQRLAQLHRATFNALQAAEFVGDESLEWDLSILLIWVSDVAASQLRRTPKRATRLLISDEQGQTRLSTPGGA